MKDSLLTKLDTLDMRFDELAGLLSDPDVIGDTNRFRDLSREYSRLEPVVGDYRAYRGAQEELEAAEAMAGDADAEMKELAREEAELLREKLAALEPTLMKHLVPTDPADEGNLYLEIRAGTGGDEAALFAGDLYRMYSRYADGHGFTVELVSANEGEHGGYKEAICRIVGRGAYGRLKFESGTHRVQRVPETESQGRIHTSACTVAVLPEAEQIDDIEINDADLRIDTYRASGAGGQHVNKTDSAVRITHLPSGIVVECQDERSQHKNKDRAKSLLRARLLAAERERQDSERAESRRLQVGSGDRSERIRTYNFPQNRVTDHRINLTLYKLDDILAGHVDQVIDPLNSEHQADLLASLGE